MLAKRGAHHLGHTFPFLVDLPFGESHYIEAKAPQLEVPRPIVLKGNPTTVMAIAVGFDHEPLLSPEKVDE